MISAKLVPLIAVNDYPQSFTGEGLHQLRLPGADAECFVTLVTALESVISVMAQAITANLAV